MKKWNILAIQQPSSKYLTHMQYQLFHILFITQIICNCPDLDLDLLSKYLLSVEFVDILNWTIKIIYS